MNIYSNKYENLVLWAGDLHEGKTLNIERTDNRFTESLTYLDWETVMRDFEANESDYLVWDKE